MRIIFSMLGFLLLACIAPARVCRADVPSLIAGLHAGDELRYTHTLATDETVTLTGKSGADAAPTRTISTQSVGVVFRVLADTTAQHIVEATFESVRLTMETEGMRFEVDALGPAPDPATPAAQAHSWFHPLGGARLTLNIAPGSGEITSVRGGEDLLKTPGGSHLRRYLDPDLVRATFGAIFQLKSNSSMPPPGEKWYVKTHVYARGAKAPVWETRSVEMVEGSIATVRTLIRASGRPDEASKASVFFRNVQAAGECSWDLPRRRLLKHSRSMTIATRFERAGLMHDSDMLCTEKLEPTPPGEKKAAPEAKP